MQGYSTDKYIRSETRQMGYGLSSITKCIHKYIDIYIQRYLSVLIVSMWKKRTRETDRINERKKANFINRFMSKNLSAKKEEEEEEKARTRRKIKSIGPFLTCIIQSIQFISIRRTTARYGTSVYVEIERFFIFCSVLARTTNACLVFSFSFSLSFLFLLRLVLVFFLFFFTVKNDPLSYTYTNILNPWFYSSPINNIYTNAKRNEIKSEKRTNERTKREKRARARLSSRVNQSMKVFLSHLFGSVLLHMIEIVDDFIGIRFIILKRVINT